MRVHRLAPGAIFWVTHVGHTGSGYSLYQSLSHLMHAYVLTQTHTHTLMENKCKLLPLSSTQCLVPWGSCCYRLVFISIYTAGNHTTVELLHRLSVSGTHLASRIQHNRHAEKKKTLKLLSQTLSSVSSEHILRNCIMSHE